MNNLRIAEGIYHVGDTSTLNGLDCNPYILIDGDEAVLFDPGSNLDFEVVLENIKKIVSVDKIKYVVLHHQDADICSSVTKFESLGMKFKVVTSWRVMTLAQYYGITSEYYLIEENNFNLTLESGRKLEFILTPYLHFAGAFASYDLENKILLSSDLFGAFSYNRTLFADDTYLHKMLTFHENYMPSNTVLRPVMDVLLTYDIQMILPQHGSIINKNVRKYIEALRTLECGTLLTPIKKNLMASGGYLMIFKDILERYYSLYPHESVIDVFHNISGLTFNEEGDLVGYFGAPDTVWNQIFEVIKARKGMIWITVVEPYVRTLVATYDIRLPAVLHSLIKSAEIENRRLLEMNESLEQTIKSVNEKLIKCSVTGLYNEVFLKSLLIEELENEDWREFGAFACIAIDDFSKYKLKYGIDEERNVLKNIAYLLKGNFGKNVVFRLESADFGLYIKGLDQQMLIDKMEEIRIDISKSDFFLGTITVSIGIVLPHEIELDAASYDSTVLHYMELSINRLINAKIMGKNYVCYEGNTEMGDVSGNSVLVVDSDETNLEVIKVFVEKLGVVVHTATDGYKALELAEDYKPNIIVTEINLPKMDGFLLREELLSNSKTKTIETIYLSYQKDEDSVNRALSLGVLHYLKKPYLLSELLGIIKRNVKGAE